MGILSPDDRIGNPGESSKACRGCGVRKSLEDFSFLAKTGRPISRCKPCNAEAARQGRERHRAENPEPPKPPTGDTKQCSKCNETMPRSEFYVKHKASGRLYSWCKACHCKMSSERIARLYRENPEPFKQRTRDYIAANRDEVNRRKRENRLGNLEECRRKEREWSNRPENLAKKAEYRRRKAEHRRQYHLSYYKRNKPKILEYTRTYRESHPWIYAEASRRWARLHPERAKLSRARARHKRRALIAKAGGTYTQADWEAIKSRQDYTCLICGLREPFIKLTVDHVIPISKGGTNYPENLAGLCGPCNSSKNNRLIDVRDYFKLRRKPHSQFAR